MKNWVCDGLVFFRGAADGLLCAGGRRSSRCGCSGGPLSGMVDLTCEAVDDTAQGLRGLLRFQEHATSSCTNSPTRITRAK